ncbi:hypothetical protein LXA43DRAFT_1064286 [Ganoderma leucocontextum]|nr:hypothetical protein LXA43DRAFT_1064286 [Ganoderma leucocontextum]
MSEPTSSHKWEELLADKDIVVVKKATFFRTVNRLFVFARAPGRHTWEFFSYRAWQYIFGTCCGAQHPFIFRWVIGDKTTLRYALPDYVLLDHATDPDGEQEDRLVLIVEIKALRIVNPDTQVGRTTAEDIFHKTWKQRLSQAKLAFQCHPTQQEVHIVMIAGPWFALYVYGRSQLMGDAPSGNPEGRSLRDRDSRPRKRWRRGEDGAWRGPDDETAQSTDTQKLASATVLEDKGEQGRSLRWDRGKRKRSREAEAEHANAPVVAKHVLQLRPSGDSDALNPWFLRLLGQMKQNLEHFSGEFTTQKSWFDCPITASDPSDDGHAEGFVLPAGIPSLEVSSAVEGVDDVERLDEDPVLANVPSTPGNGRETLNA